jgi:dihydroorotate dehydrogenase electron transfer subunit
LSRPRRHQRLQVMACRELGADLFHLILRLESGHGEALAFAAGQFAQLAVPGHVLPRPFSILRSSNESLEFLVRRVGTGSAWLCSRRPGEEIPVLWPLGNSFLENLPPEAGEEELLLVGGGVGIAPLLAFQEQWNGEKRLLFGHRDAASVKACLPIMGKAQPLLSTEDGSHGVHGRVTRLLEIVLEEEADRPRRILCCGPDAMMAAVAALAKARHLPCLLSLETLMGCGIGICVGCAVPLASGQKALACQAGPVFHANALAESAKDPAPPHSCACGGRP